jgi:TonB family protein
MYADFSLRIDRSGIIKEVNIMRTSGNDTFDRAAMNAIKKYKKIKGMDKIDEETYRIYFANFTLRFNPDD